MLIGIRHPKGVETGAEYAKQVAEHVDGTTRIYNPRTLEEYAEAVSSYRLSAKKHLILLSTADDLDRSAQPLEYQRLLELHFINKGGSVYGVQSPDTLTTWVGDLPENPALVAKNSLVAQNRAIYSKKLLGLPYYGRITTDPHTVLVGAIPAGPLKASGIVKQIITSLPAQWGIYNEVSRPSDWSGVSYMKVVSEDKLRQAAEWLAESNFVALGQAAHDALEAAEIVHGAAPIPVGNGRFNNQATTPKYGLLIRDVAKTNEVKLDWKP